MSAAWNGSCWDQKKKKENCFLHHHQFHGEITAPPEFVRIGPCVFLKWLFTFTLLYWSEALFFISAWYPRHLEKVPFSFSLILQGLERRWTKISSFLLLLVCLSLPCCIPDSLKWFVGTGAVVLFFFNWGVERNHKYKPCDILDVNVTLQNCSGEKKKKKEIAQGIPRSHVNILRAFRFSELNFFLKLFHMSSIYCLIRKSPAVSSIDESTYNVSTWSCFLNMLKDHRQTLSRKVWMTEGLLIFHLLHLSTCLNSQF